MAAPHEPQPPTISSPLTDDSSENANTGSKQEVCITCGGGSDGSQSIYTRVRGRPLIQVLAMLLCRPVVEVDTGPDGHICPACLVKFDVVIDLLERLVAVSREFIKGYNAALKLRRSNKRQLEDKYDGWVEEDECLLVVEGMLVEDNQAGIVSRALAMANSRPKKETKKRRYVCTVCGKDFAAYSHRVEHMLVHTRERNFPCDMCDYSATTRSNLTKHRQIHTNPVTCTICHKQLSNKFSLKEHMNLHTKEKSHPCSHCHKVFWRRQDKRLHERTHQSDGWYSCPTCNKSFVVKSRLARHMLTHQSIKQFECEVCHKKFSRKDDVLCHARIHTGERPYVCVVCGRQFRYASNCRNHARTHTRGQDPFSCATCNLTFPSKAKHTTHLKSKNHKKKMSERTIASKCEKIPEGDGTAHIFCQLCKMSYSLTDYALHKPICSDKILESVEQLSDHTLQSAAESPLTHTIEHTLTLSADQTMENTLTHASDHTVAHTDHTITHTDHALADSLTHTTESGIMLSDYTGIILPLDKLAGETNGVNVVVTVKADSSPLHHHIIAAPSSTTGFSTSSTTSNTTGFSITNPAFTSTSTTTTTTVLKNTIPTTTDFSNTSTNLTTSTTTDFPINTAFSNTSTKFTTPTTILNKTSNSTNTTILPITLGRKPGVSEGEAMRGEVLTEISDVEAAAEGSQSPPGTTISIHNPATEFKISDWDFQQYYQKP